MGIPHVQALLQPYATPICFQLNTTTSVAVEGFLSSAHGTNDNHAVVIDGPALAYHAFAIAVANVRRNSRTNLIRDRHGIVDIDALSATRRATPSYQAIASAMLAWLDALQSHGVRVELLVFD